MPQLRGPSSPISPIGKRSGLPALSVATGRGGGSSLRNASPLGMAVAALRVSSPLLSRSPMQQNRGSLSNVRFAAKATAGLSGPNVSHAGSRLPSPFQMAPSLAAKRERVRSRWPSAARAVAEGKQWGVHWGNGYLEDRSSSPGASRYQPPAPSRLDKARSFEEAIGQLVGSGATLL